LDLHLPGVASLKEKRFILKSVKIKIRNKFNVSIAEIDYLDKWQRAGIGVACVSNERRFIESTLSKVINTIEQDDRIELIGSVSDFL